MVATPWVNSFTDPHTLKASLLPIVIPPVLWGIKSTWQVRREYHPETEALLKAGNPVIYAVWHGRMYSVLRGVNPKQVSILISASTDGEMITRVIQNMGFPHVIRGSHRRQGTQALRAMIKTVQQQKRSLVFMVDGPQGPRYHVKPGIIKLASQTQVPIVPMVSASRWYIKKFTESWDHFHAPQLFTPMVIRYGAPLYIPDSLNEPDAVEQLRAQLETTMGTLTQEVDQALG